MSYLNVFSNLKIELILKKVFLPEILIFFIGLNCLAETQIKNCQIIDLDKSDSIFFDMQNIDVTFEKPISEAKLRLWAKSISKLEYEIQYNNEIRTDYVALSMRLDKIKSELNLIFASGGKSIYFEEKSILFQKLNLRSRTLGNQSEEKGVELKQLSDKVSNFSRKILLNTVKEGHFNMGVAQVPTEISKSFQMMSTKVSQLMWATLSIAMGETQIDRITPSHFKTGPSSEIVNIDGFQLQMNPHYPVEKVNWYRIIFFIKELNRLSMSEDSKIQSLLRNLISDHKYGDVYDLPTEAQWEFVLRNRGRNYTKFFDKSDDSEVAKYAWFDKNSAGETHEVDSLLPRIVDGNFFYGLEGNVHEWMKDNYSETLTGGIDPTGSTVSTYRVIRGGSWNEDVNQLSADRRQFSIPSNSNYIGFRLIRIFQ
jgi:formylglycine-generating enzyme required for sulfatase activity